MSAWPKAALRCDFPEPLGPNNRIVPPRSIHPSPVASAATWARLSIGTAAKSKLSRVLPGGRRASIRCWKSKVGTPKYCKRRNRVSDREGRKDYRDAYNFVHQITRQSGPVF